MKVKCVKSVRKLIGGVLYDSDKFWNSGNVNSGYSRFLKGIVIKGYGHYNNIENFTDEFDNPLPKIDYRSNDEYPKIDWDIKSGDIITCDSDRYKYLIRGQKYRIVDVRKFKTYKGLSVPKSSSLNRSSIKLEGYDKWIKFNPWIFKKLSISDLRDLSISQILISPENFQVEFVRKFEKLNKNKALMECLSRSILDKHRHHYSILEWSV